MAASNVVFIGNVPFTSEVGDVANHLSSLNLKCSVALIQSASGRSKGCALATFESDSEAAAAITAISSSSLGDRTLFARADKGPFSSNTQSKREPIKRNTEPSASAPSNRLYVGNLTNDVVEADLEEAFSPFGEIVRCQVSKGKSGRNMGTVEFSQEESASGAIAGLNGKFLLDKEMVVEYLKRVPRVKSERKSERKPRSSRKRNDTTIRDIPEVTAPVETSTAAPVDPSTVFIGNLATSVTEEELLNLFKVHGEVLKVSFSVDKRTQRRRGWARVKFADVASASAAIQELNGFNLNDRVLTVEVSNARKRAPRAPRRSAPREETQKREPVVRAKKVSQPQVVHNASCHLFVGNLDWNTNEEDLKQHFAHCGNVVNSTVTRSTRSKSKKPQRSRGWGTVEMSSANEAQAAIESLHNTEFNGRNLVVRLDEKLVQA